MTDPARKDSPAPATAAPGSPKDEGGITPLSLVVSVLGAAFGVQSRKNRERDFTKGNIYVFIVAGVVFTALFVATVWTVVQMVLPDSP
jgi:NhaP-type Na+/H+ or K+/H+ antiporter